MRALGAVSVWLVAALVVPLVIAWIVRVRVRRARNPSWPVPTLQQIRETDERLSYLAGEPEPEPSPRARKLERDSAEP